MAIKVHIINTPACLDHGLTLTMKYIGIIINAELCIVIVKATIIIYITVFLFIKNGVAANNIDAAKHCLIPFIVTK